MTQKQIAGYTAAVLGVVVILSQFARIMTFLRNRFTSGVVTNDILKRVANDTGASVSTVAGLVRTDYCKGVASTIFQALHEKPLGFLPRSWFGSTEDEETIVNELRKLKNGKEAAFLSSYYFEKYQKRLKSEIYKFLSSTDLAAIPNEIKNNLN